ncbi:MAG: hypothetical protein K9G46_07155 [Flavobacteriales bacterium]|nr:hypothetical protein [Flavobacteriales bacterium]
MKPIKNIFTVLVAILAYTSASAQQPRPGYSVFATSNSEALQSIQIDNRLYVDNELPLANGTAALEVRSDSRGVLLSRMTTTQRNAISAPATGLIIYNTSTDQFNYYDGSAWLPLVSSESSDTTTFTGNVVFDGNIQILGECDTTQTYVLSNTGNGNACWQPTQCCSLDGSYSAGRTITADAGAVEILGYGAQQLLNIKDTADGYSSAWLQMYGSGAIRTGGYLDLTGLGFDDGTAYPYEDMPSGGFVAGVNNRVTGLSNPYAVGSAALGLSNHVNNSTASFATGLGNIIDGAGTGNSAIIGGAYNTITANDQNVATMAIIGSTECYADSALSFIASSFQSGARGDHATVIAGYRAYANYYHQFMMGSQPIVDTTGFTFGTSSNWELNNKTFTIGNGGVDDPTPITMTNSLTQIANGNMLLGTHWKDVYDDLDTNSAILTVLGDSVGNSDGLIFEVKSKTTDVIFKISESGVTMPTTTIAFTPTVLTTTQRNALTAIAGMFIYCSDCTATDASTGVNQTYTGMTWKNHW